MARLTPAAGTVPLVAGMATAVVLSAAATYTVMHAGCEDPGTYRVRNGVVELVGGCVGAEDLPVAPATDPPNTPRPLGEEGPREPAVRP